MRFGGFMRLSAILAGLLGLVLLSPLAAPDAQAQAVPPGSYLRSCNNVQFRNGALSAVCRTRNGTWQPSMLNTLICAPRTDISNQDGSLTCPPRQELRPPPGSYMRSCRNPTLGLGGVLRAQCRTRNGAWVASALNTNQCRRGSDIANIDGQLMCR